MRRTTVICLAGGSLIAGLACGRVVTVSGLPGVALGVAGLALGWRRRRLLVPALLLLAFGSGLWRSELWVQQQAELTALIGQTVTLTGVVADDPASSPAGQVDFRLGDVRLGSRRLPGQIAIRDYPVRLQRGYRVELAGKIRAGYGNVPVSLGFPRVTVVSTQQSALEQWRQRFFAGMRTALPDPEASFGLGLLVGIRALIPKDLQAQLALVGLSHLVAVSGYNLTILVRAADRVLGRWGRGVALAVNLWLIGGFLVVTGASASIVRAALVSGLSLLAGFYGRQFHPMVLILITAAATAGYDPKYLTDLGWLLSFLAFFGILVLAPAIEARLGHPQWAAVRLFIESTAAHLMTLPLIMAAFGQLSIIAPISNLIVLPFVPLAMAVSLAAGLAGMLVPAFCGWLAWPALLLLSFMLRLVGGFAAPSWSGTTAAIGPVVMVAMYACLALATWALYHSPRLTKAAVDSKV
jgi:competence protein ComEC